MPEVSPQPTKRAPRVPPTGWLWLLAALAAWNLLLALIPHGPPRAAVPYTVFRQQVEAGNVREINTSGVRVDGTLNHALRWPPGAKNPRTYTAFTTVLPPFRDDSLWSLLLAHKVTVTSAAPGNPWLVGLLVSVLPVLVIAGLLVFMTRGVQRGQAGLFGFGKSRARVYTQDRPGVTFADVAGEEEAKEALKDIIDFLRDPRPFRAVVARIPKGVLLVGPPGTGKTLLARAVAGEAGSTFYSAAASEFVEMFVGIGAARVRDLFAKAKASPPAIVFIDEIDAVGRRRGAAMGPGNEEREQTLNQLLGEMDGFEPATAVVVLAATNRPDVLDPALLRPGRFDRQVTIGLPDRPSREAILRIHSRSTPLAPDVDFGVLARGTVGFSGADLANLVNEAAIQAAHRHASHLTMEDFERAQDRIVMGGLTGVTMSEEERRVVAYHEGGHTLVALLSPGADPVRKVSIVPRGRSLGATLQVPLDDHHNYSRSYLVTRLTVLLGGRAAEELVFAESTTGAEDDLRQATTLARQMVARWGMSPHVGMIALETGRDAAGLSPTTHDYSEATAARIDRETARLIADAYARAADLLRVHRAALDRIAEMLIREDVVDSSILTQLMQERPVSAAEGAHAQGTSRG